MEERMVKTSSVRTVVYNVMKRVYISCRVVYIRSRCASGCLLCVYVRIYIVNKSFEASLVQAHCTIEISCEVYSCPRAMAHIGRMGNSLSVLCRIRSTSAVKAN